MTMQWYIDVFETLFLLGDGVKHMFPPTTSSSLLPNLFVHQRQDVGTWS